MTALSPTSVTLEGDNGPFEVSAASVVAIARSERQMGRGALAGGIIALVVVLAFGDDSAGGNAHAAFGALLILPPVGLVAGALAKRLHTIYVAPKPAAPQKP
jgi:hypothetical protein